MAWFWITYSTELRLVQPANVFSFVTIPPPHSSHLFPHTHTNVNGEILSLKCIDGLARRRPYVPLSGHVWGQINMCVQWVAWCQLHQAINEEPPASQQLLTLRMKSGPRECAHMCVCVCVCVSATLLSGRTWGTQQSVRTLL